MKTHVAMYRPPPPLIIENLYFAKFSKKDPDWYHCHTYHTCHLVNYIWDHRGSCEGSEWYVCVHVHGEVCACACRSVGRGVWCVHVHGEVCACACACRSVCI